MSSFKIAVWYHCVLSGPHLPSAHWAEEIVLEQMAALRASGLADAAQEIHVGLNDPGSDALVIGSLVPARAIVHVHPHGQSELTTLRALQQWLAPGWLVFYHHAKGASLPGNVAFAKWRRCMEKACVWNWTQCAGALQEENFDTAGAHWLTHRQYPVIHPSQRYWGGNFWWARSEHLLTLPPLAEDSFGTRYEAEVWIGKSPRHPVVRDFAPHWPMNCP